MKPVLLFCVCLTLLSGTCNVSNIPVTSTVGYVEFVNRSANPYNVFIDDALVGTINANSNYTASVTMGDHHVKAVQLSGFLIYASTWQTTLHIYGGQKTQWVFP